MIYDPFGVGRTALYFFYKHLMPLASGCNFIFHFVINTLSCWQRVLSNQINICRRMLY